MKTQRNEEEEMIILPLTGSSLLVRLPFNPHVHDEKQKKAEDL